MYEGHTVAVVIPAYNEEGLVGRVIDTVPEFVDRVYAIDDRSTDETWDEIRAHAGRTVPITDGGDADSPFDQRVVPIRHSKNRGVGAAIKTGYCRAREDGIDVTAVMAGDGQMEPDMLARVIQPIVDGRADYAKGNRLSTPGFREGMSAWRSFGNWLLTFLTKVASGYWGMADPQNGYTAISGRALSELDIEAVYDDYGFANALLVRLNVHDMRVADVTMPAVYGNEQSTIRYSTFVPKLSALLLWGFLWRLKAKYLVRDFHPLAFLYGLGALGTGAGLLTLLRNRRETSDGLSATLLGGLCLVLAMTFDRHANEGLEERDELEVHGEMEDDWKEQDEWKPRDDGEVHDE
ncbi:Glycosyltransferase involved in cell wall bisynthesis [Haladaptatus litoreus]|uniref:Glycosyltransferase involved in cell wall bisynthesis n=1 Tax=Haladaptatus litoreus TaxID=553468 RepID=A0A1N6YY12_9EURY|nr:glycosyltransferase family 2 protein [Haladaptatus litoreus]SIR19503.1 Glycosyltransferase involved in cell wall bisynthesis [Haladaptatus litoreus]